MTAIDLWAFIALAVTSAALYFRGLMLRRENDRWVNAPRPVWISLMGAGIVSGGGAYSLWTGGHASGREAMVYTVWAISAVIILINLWRQRPQEPVIREILAHMTADLLVAPREAIGRAIEAVREAARRGGFHA